MPRVLRGYKGDGCLLMGEVPLYGSLEGLNDGVHPLATHSKPSALYCWILEILYCNPKGRSALLRIPTTEGRKCLPMLGGIKT